MTTDNEQADSATLTPIENVFRNADGSPTRRNVIDVDASWDPEECSLDEHRQKEFARIKQPGFGSAGKVKADGE